MQLDHSKSEVKHILQCPAPSGITPCRITDLASVQTPHQQLPKTANLRQDNSLHCAAASESHVWPHTLQRLQHFQMCKRKGFPFPCRLYLLKEINKQTGLSDSATMWDPPDISDPSQLWSPQRALFSQSFHHLILPTKEQKAAIKAGVCWTLGQRQPQINQGLAFKELYS